MRLPLIPALLVLIVGIALCFYVFVRGLRTGLLDKPWKRVVFWALPALASFAMVFATFSSKTAATDRGLTRLMWMIFVYFSIIVPMLITALGCLVQQVAARFARRRLRGIVIVAGILSLLLFVMMWWGALVTRYSLNVREVEVPIDGLPDAFDGYRIAQISDIHTGSFGDNPRFLAKMVGEINSLNPDVVLFTGDIVNRHSDELLPFMTTLAGLNAPDGVWSVMGNHDYGEYYRWSSEQARVADVARLKKLQADMGWKMLNNSHDFLRRGSDSIVIVGVENIGDPPFTTYGDLKKAYPALSDSNVKILMSHNPAHWRDSIAGKEDVNVALTLSGHTHAMQIELFGWSPASLRYKTWGGLYPDSLGRHLYVNIGIGEVGFPSRIGANPEITLITLRRK